MKKTITSAIALTIISTTAMAQGAAPQQRTPTPGRGVTQKPGNPRNTSDSTIKTGNPVRPATTAPTQPAPRTANPAIKPARTPVRK